MKKITRHILITILILICMASLTGAVYAETTSYGDEVPDLTYGYSEFTGPWAFIYYAKDERTSYTYHEASDGDYYPSRGDLMVIGGDYSKVYPSEEDLLTSYTGLGEFEYWHSEEVWNGHILYIEDVSDDGVLTCFEGDTIAPYQDLSTNDPDYDSKSSIDYIYIDYYTGDCLTEGKVSFGKIRAFIETDFSDEFLYSIDQTLRSVYYRFQYDPDGVRSEICSLYPVTINWCSLFIHYILLNSII